MDAGRNRNRGVVGQRRHLHLSGFGRGRGGLDAHRARLGALVLSGGDRREIVSEVKVAFGLNQASFDELGADLDRYRR